MGIWTYTKDGRTLGLCNEDINQASASTCSYQMNVFLWIFLSTFLIFAILDVLPISAHISSSGTRCSHLRIFMVQFLLCLVVSFVVADVGLDLARTSIRMNNPIWHVAWAMPFVLSLLSKLGPCLICCLPKWVKHSQTRDIKIKSESTQQKFKDKRSIPGVKSRSNLGRKRASPTNKTEPSKKTETLMGRRLTLTGDPLTARRKTLTVLPEMFGVQGAGKQRENAHARRESIKLTRGKTGSVPSLDGVTSIDTERFSHHFDEANNDGVGHDDDDEEEEDINSCLLFCDDLIHYLCLLSHYLQRMTGLLFGGIAWDLYETYSSLLSLVSVYIYVHGTYETSAYRSQVNVISTMGHDAVWRNDCPSTRLSDQWTHGPQEFLECAFFIDFFLRLLATRTTKFKEFSSVYTLCDLMSISMLPAWLLGLPFELVRSLGCLRFLRLLRICTHYEITSRLSKIQLRKWKVYMIISLLFMINAGLILAVEYGEESGFVCFHDALYFSVVSLLTVGLGDFVPISATGRILSTLMLIIGVVLVSYQLNELEAANRRQAKFKYSGTVDKAIEGHVLIVADIFQIETCQVFLDEFCHPNHRGVDHQRLPTIVLLCPHPPSTELEHLLEVFNSGSSHSSGGGSSGSGSSGGGSGNGSSIKIQYLQGLPSSVKDLHRVGVSRAKSVFIIANSKAKEKDRDAVDMQIMLTALAISKSSPKTTHILSQVLLPESISSVRAAGAHVVVCESSLRYSILANSYWSNGVSAFISNLARSSDLDGSDYADGCDWEIYTVDFSSSLIGCTFDVVTRRVLKEPFPRPMLIGVIQHDCKPSRVVLNPPHHYIIGEHDEAIVMAVDLKHAEEIMEMNMLKDLKAVATTKHDKNDEFYNQTKEEHYERKTRESMVSVESSPSNSSSDGLQDDLLGRGGSSHSNIFTTNNRATIMKIKKVIRSGLIKSQQKRNINALSDCHDFRDHIVIMGTITCAVNLLRHLCLCESDEDNKQLLPPVVVLTLSSDEDQKAKLVHQHQREQQREQHQYNNALNNNNSNNSNNKSNNNSNNNSSNNSNNNSNNNRSRSNSMGSNPSGNNDNDNAVLDEHMKYLNSVCAGLMHGVVGSVEDLLCSGATHASMVVLLSNRQIEMEEGYHTDGMSIRTTLLLRSECQKMDLPEPYIVTELFNSANTVFIDSTSWGGSNAKTKSHYTLSPVFSEGKIYTSALNDTLLGMSYYVPRMAECLVAMIDGPSKLRHFEVPREFVGKTYIEIVKYLQAHETIAVAVVSKGLAVGVEQRSEDDVSIRTALTLWKVVAQKYCCKGTNRSTRKTIVKKTKANAKTKRSLYTKKSWSRMDLMSLNESDFMDAKHQCVITSPPDTRVLTKGDKILVLRPFESSPSNLGLGFNALVGRSSTNKLGSGVKWQMKKGEDLGPSEKHGGGGGGGDREAISRVRLKSGKNVSSYIVVPTKGPETVGPETEEEPLDLDSILKYMDL